MSCTLLSADKLVQNIIQVEYTCQWDWISMPFYSSPDIRCTFPRRVIPVLRGSSPQKGDPLGIYPGGGLDSRIDPALVPEARAQLGDEVSVDFFIKIKSRFKVT